MKDKKRKPGPFSMCGQVRKHMNVEMDSPGELALRAVRDAWNEDRKLLCKYRNLAKKAKAILEAETV